MTDQNVIKGSAPTMHVVYNASTNRQTGDTADLNGNIGSGYLYDIENRLLRPGASSTVQYGYDAGNKRVWRGDTGVDEIVFWAGSQKLITYNVTRSGSTITGIASSSTNVYFGGRLMYKGAPNYPASSLLTGVKQDRLGSMNGKFYPYGQERPSATANDKEKFTGYFRDASTGLDYADQRYHQSGVGRFMTPDPYGGSARANDPGNWNRHAYVGGDPINRNDPNGLCDVVIGGIRETDASNTGTAEFAASLGAMAVFPYSDTGQTGTLGLLEIAMGAGGVVQTAVDPANAVTLAVTAAILAAAADSDGPINIYAFSGGAQAFKAALGRLPQDVIDRIQSITYASPGVIGNVATANGIVPTVVHGSGLPDEFATSLTIYPTEVFGPGFIPLQTGCEHQAGCEFAAAPVAAGNSCRQASTFSLGVIPYVDDSLHLNDDRYWNPVSLDQYWIDFGGPSPVPFFPAFGFGSGSVVSCWTDGLGGRHCF